MKKFLFSSCVFILFSFLLTEAVTGRQALPLNDLSVFKTIGKTWKTGSVFMSDFSKTNDLSLTDGSGVLANLPGGGGADLYTNAGYSNVDIELEYMMIEDFNSGIYLQGRYEVQLLDSWDNKNLMPEDNGGMYQRWNESRLAGQFGYERFAQRQNASKAPDNTKTMGSPANSNKAGKAVTINANTIAAKLPVAKCTFASVKNLLSKITFLACHNEVKPQVRRAYADIAKGKYSVAQTLRLIYSP